jgi:hypothetical protein
MTLACGTLIAAVVLSQVRYRESAIA